jgi:hypothetical protein
MKHCAILSTNMVLQTYHKYVLICTLFELGMYLVSLERNGTNTGKQNSLNYEIRTVDLMHSILRAIPLRYQRVFHGDIYGYYKVHTHSILRSRRTVPSGCCRTTSADPAAPPAPARTSLVRTTT